jgi:hypothetical protein
MDQLLQKLMVSKAIMDRHDDMKRGSSPIGDPHINSPYSENETFQVPNIKYNIPNEFIQEQNVPQIPKVNTKPVGGTTVDAIKNSKLPDEIKRLMIEHPIDQPKQSNPTLSNDLIEKASRLMKENKEGYIPESAKQYSNKQTSPSSSVDYNLIKKMIEEAVNNSLKQNGLITESSEKSNEVFSFRVGKHIFEGKVTKIKKVS